MPNGGDRRFQRRAVIEMDRHRHPGASRRRFGGRHRQREIEIFEMRLRQAQNRRGMALLRRPHDGFEKIETHQIERPHRIPVTVRVPQQIAHIDQSHDATPRGK